MTRWPDVPTNTPFPGGCRSPVDVLQMYVAPVLRYIAETLTDRTEELSKEACEGLGALAYHLCAEVTATAVVLENGLVSEKSKEVAP